MFKDMKLGTKISMGFGIILIIAVALGLLSVISMNGVKGGAEQLSKVRVPQILASNDVQKLTMDGMYSLRRYQFTYEPSELESGKKKFGELQESLKKAKEISDKYPDLVPILKENLPKITKNTEDYIKLINEIEKLVGISEALRNEMDVSAKAYMEEAHNYLKSQEEKINQEIKGKSSSDKVMERVLKIDLANEIIDIGNEIRITNFKAQALRDPEMAKNVLKEFDNLNAIIDRLLKVTVQEANIKQLELVKSSGAAYKASMEKFFLNWDAMNKSNDIRRDVGIDIIKMAEQLVDVGGEKTKSTAEGSTLALNLAVGTMLIGLLVAIVLGIIIAIVIITGITRPVGKIVSKISEGADQVASASGQLSSASQKLAEGASEQASALEETSSTLNESASMVQQNTENTKQAAILAEKTKDSADKGNSEMNEMSSAMDELMKSSGEIAKIIKVIDDIAFQTNILALNAAVEAARAGEAGMGFAVVAEEVRNLAQRSAQAAKDTSAIIEKNINLSERGVSVSKRVAESLGEITTQAKKVNELMDEIAAASQEQTQGIDQINRAVSQMEQVTQGSASTAEESAAASEELSAQAASMKEVIAELTRLVYGADQKGLANVSYSEPKHTEYHETPRRISQPQHQVSGALKSGRASTARPTAAKRTTVVRPEDIIPLEDDMKDF